MLGAITGNLIGSTYDYPDHEKPAFAALRNTKQYIGGKLKVVHPHYTENTVLTLAVADWLMRDQTQCPNNLHSIMREMLTKYGGWNKSGILKRWFETDTPQDCSGSLPASIISPIALKIGDLQKVKELSKMVAQLIFDNPEAVKGAEATATAIWLRKNPCGVTDLKMLFEIIENDYGYNLSGDIHHLVELQNILNGCVKENIYENGQDTGRWYWRATGRVVSRAQDVVPAALLCFKHQPRFEDSIKLATRVGGWSSSLASITGAFAEASFGPNQAINKKVESFLPDDMLEIIRTFESKSAF